MRKLLCLCLGLLLMAGPLPALAQGEESFVINVDGLDMSALTNEEYVMANLSAQTQGIRVTKFISNSGELVARVRLTLEQMDTRTLVFDKNYGYQSGTFDSDVIYLPYGGNQTVPYLITLYVEDWVYAMPFMQLQSRFYYNGACTYGVRMRDYNPSLTSDWLMGTMLDLGALRAQGSMTLPICASNAYILGQATVTMQGDALSVALAFNADANVEVQECSLFVIGDCGALYTAEANQMPQQAYGLGQWIDVSGLETALLYIPMLLSYDPANLPQFGYDLWGDAQLQRQLGLWQQNLQGASNTPTFEDVPFAEEPFAGDPFAVDPFEEGPPIEEPVDGGIYVDPEGFPGEEETLDGEQDIGGEESDAGAQQPQGVQQPQGAQPLQEDWDETEWNWDEAE